MSERKTVPVWYCPHCSKRIEGDPRGDAILIWRGSEPRHYKLCKECTAELQIWLEGGE